MYIKNSLYKVGRFPQLERKVYTESDGLLSDNITAVCYDGDNALLIGTDKGLCKLKDGKFTEVDFGVEAPYISMLGYCGGTVYVGVEKSLYMICNGSISKEDFSSQLISVKVDGDGVTWILTKSVLYRKNTNGIYDMKIGVPGSGTCLAVLRDNTVYVGTAGFGLHALSGKRWHWKELTQSISDILSDHITCVELDSIGNVWIGTDKGVCVYDDNGYWVDTKQIERLPSSSITDMAVAQNGDRYFATDTGLIVMHNGLLDYYGYKRWLPSPKATAVALGQNGSFCVCTDAGLSVFTTEYLTLEEKALRLRAVTERFNVRKDGWVLQRQLEHEGVLSTDEGYIDNTDNDGHWTGQYVAALSYQYACTKDENVKKDARRSLLALFKLIDITGIPGFAARAIRYPDEKSYKTGNRKEWHVVNEGTADEAEWLGETSSDEMVGHFFAYANYFDLVADDYDKQLICKYTAEILEHIITHNFRLVDADGTPTTWANWNPELLNNCNKWAYEKGTNSLQILTFLKIGYHMTGDKKYEDLFNMLANDKHYAMNLMKYKLPDGHIIHIDDNHDFLMISLLMKYTDDSLLRSMFSIGLSQHWLDERDERTPFFNFVYGAVTGERCDIENAVEELEEYPMDPIMWTLYNSYRPDLEWDMYPVKLGLIPQLKSPVSGHERRITNNDSNRFIADSGISGKAEELFLGSDDPTAYTMLPPTGNDRGMEAFACTNYILPYWYARYNRLIED